MMSSNIARGGSQKVSCFVRTVSFLFLLVSAAAEDTVMRLDAYHVAIVVPEASKLNDNAFNYMANQGGIMAKKGNPLNMVKFPKLEGNFIVDVLHTESTQVSSSGVAFKSWCNDAGLAQVPVNTASAAACQRNMKQLIEKDNFQHFVLVGFTCEALAKFVMGYGENGGDEAFTKYLRSKDIRFSIIDSELAVAPRPSNCPWCDNSILQSYNFNVDENSYIAGAYAGLVSQSKILACVQGVYGPILDIFCNAYRLGVRKTCPECVIEAHVVNAFWGESGIKWAENMVQRGVDLTFVAAGGWADATLRKLSQMDTYIIGVDADIYNTTFAIQEKCDLNCQKVGRSHLLTSVLKRLDVAVYDLIKNDLQYKFYGGTVVSLGLSNDGVGLAPPYETFSTWSKYEVIINKLVASMKLRNVVPLDDNFKIPLTSTSNTWRQLISLSSRPLLKGKGFAYHAAATSKLPFIAEMYMFSGSTMDITGNLADSNELWSHDSSNNAYIYRTCETTFQPLFGDVDCSNWITPHKRSYAKMIKLDAGFFLFGGSYTNEHNQRIVLTNDCWLLVSGVPFFIGDHQEDAWKPVSCINAPVVDGFNMEAVSGVNGLLFGGMNDKNIIQGDLYKFDYDNAAMKATWTLLSPTGGEKPSSRSFAASLVHDGYLYILGGKGMTFAERALKDVWRISVANLGGQLEWEKLVDMPLKRSAAVAGVVQFLGDDKVVSPVIAVVGGNDERGVITNDVLLLDIQNTCKQRWESCSEENCPRRSKMNSQSAEKLNICGDFCVVSPELLTSERAGHSAVFVNDIIITYGGLDGKGGITSDTWVYRVGLVDGGAVEMNRYDPSFNNSGGYPDVCAFRKFEAPYEPIVQLVLPQNLVTCTIVLSGIGVLNVVLWSVWLFFNKKRPAIIASTPAFVCIMLFGALICQIGVLLYASPLFAMCAAGTALMSIGFSLMLYSVLIKGDRVVKIFTAADFSKKAITLKDLLTTIAVSVGSEVVFIIIWFGVDPPYAMKNFLGNAAWLECSCNSGYWYLVFGVKFIALLKGVEIAYKMKTKAQVQNSLFDESRELANIIFNMAAVSFFAAPVLIFSTPTQISIRHIALCWGLLWIVNASVLMFFLPKLHYNTIVDSQGNVTQSRGASGAWTGSGNDEDKLLKMMAKCEKLELANQQLTEKVLRLERATRVDPMLPHTQSNLALEELKRKRQEKNNKRMESGLGVDSDK
jgi:basic membrane lipoprotein Med (substrate-binding protein (PBP1-ABC) superfamily)